jgi:hypothetical protein
MLTALNAPSTAQAATRCVSLGWTRGDAHGLLALRPGRTAVHSAAELRRQAAGRRAGKDAQRRDRCRAGVRRVSLNGATGTWGRGIVCALSLGALAWVATRRRRSPIVDAFLIGIVVSLVANDTPQDVPFWGAITGVGLWRAV